MGGKGDGKHRSSKRSQEARRAAKEKQRREAKLRKVLQRLAVLRTFRRIK